MSVDPQLLAALTIFITAAILLSALLLALVARTVRARHRD